jgi:hypothetical protein
MVLPRTQAHWLASPSTIKPILFRRVESSPLTNHPSISTCARFSRLYERGVKYGTKLSGHSHLIHHAKEETNDVNQSYARKQTDLH